MPTKKLTDLFVERATPPARGRKHYFDAAFPGLALRVTDKGGKSWCLYYRINGRQRLLTIGGYPAIKPAQARMEAQAALERVRLGADPAEEKRTRRDQLIPETDTFGALVDDYLERYLKRHKPKSYSQVKRIFEREALPKWRTRPLAAITRRDVIHLLDGLIERDAPVQANRALAWLRALFNWAIEKERLAVSPAANMKLPTPEQARDRVLTDDELQWFWQGCDEIGWPFGPLCKLLLLTAQRREEVAAMIRGEIDLDKRTWTIPRRKAKNDQAHEVQLSDAAIVVLKSLDRVGADDDDALVFSTTGETAVSGFSRAKSRLDRAMFSAKGSGASIPNWTFHDLRRTAATGMAKLNVPPHVVDKILNHSSGTIQGVAAIYNRFAYLDERRAALEAWGRYVDNLVTPAPANVVPMRRG